MSSKYGEATRELEDTSFKFLFLLYEEAIDNAFDVITYQRNVNKLKSFKEEPLDNSFLKKGRVSREWST